MKNKFIFRVMKRVSTVLIFVGVFLLLFGFLKRGGDSLTVPIGAFLTVSCLAALIHVIIQEQRANHLAEKGIKGTAAIIKVQQIASGHNKGRPSFIIHCSLVDEQDGKVHNIRTDELFFDPRPAMEEYDVTQLPVVFNKNYRRYTVDAERLEMLAHVLNVKNAEKDAM